MLADSSSGASTSAASFNRRSATTRMMAIAATALSPAWMKAPMIVAAVEAMATAGPPASGATPRT